MKKSLFTSLMLGILISEPLTAQTGADNPFGNALIPDMIADASIQEINGTFYCYATTDGYGRGLETSGPPVVWNQRTLFIGALTVLISLLPRKKSTGHPARLSLPMVNTTFIRQ